MLNDFTPVWDVLGIIIQAIPSDVSSVIAFVFCSIGVVGMFRSF